jgi:peroxiredoxin
MRTSLNRLIPIGLVLTTCLVASNCAAQADDPRERGAALVLEVARVYQDAPAMTDDILIKTVSRGVERTDASHVKLGPGTDAQVVIEGFEMTALDGQFIVEHVDQLSKYLKKPLEGNLHRTFAAMAGGKGLPVPHLELRYGKTLHEYVQAFGLSRATDLSITGVESVQRDGIRFEQLDLHGPDVSVNVLIDPKTKFIRWIEITAPGSVITQTLEPRRYDRLPDPIEVATAGRRSVETIPQLVSITVGDDAPDFTLENLDGAEVSLADHRGSVVVLDFWATWCRPCQMGLPKLQEFADWGTREGLPVVVLAVNMGERQPTRKAKKARVAGYWKSKGFTMPTLMDYESTIARAFQVGSIPHTVVVDPKGKVVEVQIGYNPDALNHLKRVTRQALGG